MEEKRIAPRLEEENEVTISVISSRKNSPKEKIIYNETTDISASGAKIRTNILLPIDTLLNIDLTLKNLQQKINAIGKVKWIKIIIDDESYEAGVEFVNAPIYAIQRLEDYIFWKQKKQVIIRF
jgi:c-di-GMP-binding flagellar brake protein YcgR